MNPPSSSGFDFASDDEGILLNGLEPKSREVLEEEGRFLPFEYAGLAPAKIRLMKVHRKGGGPQLACDFIHVLLDHFLGAILGLLVYLGSSQYLQEYPVWKMLFPSCHNFCCRHTERDCPKGWESKY